jgi:GTP-binding protein
MGLGPSSLAFTVLKPGEVPLAQFPRWAVLGRSNVGKSTFLNALTHPHVLFKTGKNPGVTRGLIGVQIRLGKSEESTIELVDMPGFGFAKGHSIDSAGWDALGEALRDQSVERGLQWIWLADPRRAPEDLERSLLGWLEGQPYTFVFTKSDGIRQAERAAAEKVWKPFIENATEGPFWTSALKGDGMDPIFKSARSFVRNHA